MLGLIMAVALKPTSGPSILLIWSDKVWHLLAFLFLMVWFCGLYRPRRYWIIFACLLLYGVLIEVLQAFLPYRNVEVADVVADGAGLVIGWLAALLGLARWPLWVENRLRKD